jgi:hypothetical protein
MRGPIVYCLEGTDHPNIDLRDLQLQPDQPAEATWRSDLLGGVTTIRAAAKMGTDPRNLKSSYQPAASSVLLTGSLSQSVVFVPYYAWANREPGQMLVWVRRQA